MNALMHEIQSTNRYSSSHAPILPRSEVLWGVPLTDKSPVITDTFLPYLPKRVQMNKNLIY